MSLWWIPAGIAAWFLVAIVVALCIGPVLGRCSRAREAADQRRVGVPYARKPAWEDRPTASSNIARRERNVTL